LIRLAGGGTTFEAAEANDRNWIGTELYDCAYVEQRLQHRFEISVGRKPRFNYEVLFNHENRRHPVLRGSSGQGMSTRLADRFLEIQQVILDTKIYLEETSEANGAAVIREAVDAAFSKATDWKQIKSGGVDWSKQRRYNQSFAARVGVAIQVSARSDLLIRDVVHPRNNLQKAEIDIGVIIVPDDRM